MKTIATTRLIPLHASGQKNIAKSLADILDYGKNPAKTDNGRLVPCYECDLTNCTDQFLMKKQIYKPITGRKEQSSSRNVVAYQIRQSFAPDDNITPKQANILGMELARKFSGDDFQIVVCTHIDTAHIHNHIYFNSTSLDCSNKFNNEKNSVFQVQALSDEICREHGLSVVEEKSGIGVDYGEWLDNKQGLDWKAIYKADIDRVIPQCKDIGDFKRRMKKLGYSVRGKKTLSLKHPDRQRGMKTERIDSTLDYSLEGIQYAIQHNGHMLPKQKKIDLVSANKINLLVELEGKTGGFKKWAEKQNLKELTKAYNYLKAHGLSDMDGLTARVRKLTQEFNVSGDRIKAIEQEIEKSNPAYILLDGRSQWSEKTAVSSREFRGVSPLTSGQCICTAIACCDRNHNNVNSLFMWENN